MYLSFENGNFIDERRETELYRSIEMRHYLDRYSGYATLRIDSIDLLNYLSDNSRPEYDEIFPSVLQFIEQMTQKGGKDDISLSIEDVKNILNEGNLAVFTSAKGDDIEEMVSSLVGSMTDEVLTAKGCLIHLTMHKDYPLKNVEKIVNRHEERLQMYNNASCIFGTKISEEVKIEEVEIRILVSV